MHRHGHCRPAAKVGTGNMRRRVWAVLPALALLAAACQTPFTNPPSQDEPKGVRHGTLRVLDQADVEALDPGVAYGAADLALLRGMVRTLYSFDSSRQDSSALDPVPDLASGPYQISDDRRTYTFTIRKGIRYAPPYDATVQAKDFVYAIERQFDPHQKVHSPNPYASLIQGFAEYAAGKARTISGMQAIGESTLKITLRQPASDFPSLLTMPFFSPVPQRYARRYQLGEDYAKHLIATGSYALARYSPGERIELVRNQNWDPETDPLRKAWVDRVEVTIGSNESAIQAAIEQGDADLNLDLTPPPNADLQPAGAQGDQPGGRQARAGARARRCVRRRAGVDHTQPHPRRLREVPRPLRHHRLPRRPGRGQGAAQPGRLPQRAHAQLRRPFHRQGAGGAERAADVAGARGDRAEPQALQGLQGLHRLPAAPVEEGRAPDRPGALVPRRPGQWRPLVHRRAAGRAQDHRQGQQQLRRLQQPGGQRHDRPGLRDRGPRPPQQPVGPDRPKDHGRRALGAADLRAADVLLVVPGEAVAVLAVDLQPGHHQPLARPEHTLTSSPAFRRQIPGCRTHATLRGFTHAARGPCRLVGTTARAVYRLPGGNQLDHLRGVGVGVGLLPAGSAGEHPAAAGPGRRVPDAARRTRLAGTRRQDQPQLRPEAGRLVGKLAAALRGRVVEDAAVEPRLLLHVAPRLLACPSGCRRQVLDPQILDADPAVAFGEVGGELVGEVGPPPGLSRSQLGDLVNGAAYPLGVPPPVVAPGPVDLASLPAL